MRTNSILSLFVPILMLFSVLLTGCSKEQEAIANLVLEKQTLHLKPGETQIVKIQSGGNNYQAQSSNPNLLKASITADEVVLKAEQIQGDAELKVYVSDANYSRAEITVTISSYEQLALHKTAVNISEILLKDTLLINHGEAPYRVEFSDPYLTDWKLVDNKVILTARAKGTGTIRVTDSRNKTAEATLTVDRKKQFLNFSDQYFGYANFADISLVDQSVKQIQKFTMEMTCNIQGYRGLQTFLGLEGNLIIRGKNDDYRDTHPIEIAGLGDKIMLETKNSFSLNKWMNIALVFDGSKSAVEEKYKFYINGVEEPLIVRRSDATHQSIDLTSSNDGNRFAVGRAFGQDWRALRGSVSEVRVWSVARTADQIKNSMCALSEDKPTGLLAKWEFSSGVASNYIPDSNHGKYSTDLIIANAKASGSYTPTIAPLNLFNALNCPF